jgi:hypothetical protein
MAAHTPMELEHRRGHEIRDADSGEGQVLNALLETIGDKARNTLIAVTGSSGAGKSHVVRWVHANLDHANAGYHILYVPRAVQTIRQLLKRIVEGLPGGGGVELMERVDAAVGSTTPAELQDRLLEAIGLALTWTLEPIPARDGEDASQAEEREMRNSLLGIPDEQGKRRNGLADLLDLPQVNRTLLRSGGLLERFTDSVYRETSSRGDQQEGFTEKDLPLREPGMRRALRDNRELLDLWNVITQNPKPALRLLNEALAQAAPRTLGFHAHHGETLDSLFRRSRQLLRAANKELVLLFEDLVQFGLIDGELYDQFTTQPGDDMAPLRVVFAVTDGPYDELGETVKTRITHRFAVNSASTVDQNAFVARYLNLVRVGRTDAEKAWAEAAVDGGEWLRNACDTREDGNPCRFRDRCHAGFGTVDVPHLGQVGLYPYNEVALKRALKGRGDNPTPRDVLDVCVIEELVEADTHISDGTYPHARVRERFDFTVQHAKDVVLDGRTGEQAERLYRAQVLWGDETNLSPVVAEAFSIQLPKKDTIPSRSKPKPEQPRPEAKPKQPDNARHVNPLSPVYQWQNGTELPGSDADEYRSILHKMVSQRLDLDQDLFHTAGDGTGGTLLKSLFPGNSFVIEGAARGRKPAETKIRLDLTRSPEDVRVLIAAKWFADHGDWNGRDAKWKPEGYEPLELMLTLEHRLDQWAEQVRQRFLREARGRDVARAAIGLRAVALLALGTPPDKLKTLNDVLGSRPKSGAVVPGWEEVDKVARDVLGSVSAVDLIANFAAVRQGDTGGPQLVDAVGLRLDLKAVMERPFEYLHRIGDEVSEASTNVVNWARKLAAAVDKAATNQLPQLVEASAYLAAELGDHAPKAVAQATRNVGKHAVDSGLFRPAKAVEAFHDAADVVERLPSSIPLAWRSDDDRSAADQALAAQGWAGLAIRGAQALAVLKDSMEATRAECARNDQTSDDLEARTQAVRMTLSSIRRALEELSTVEDGRG